MTYNANIPLSSDSPSLFPVQSQSNFNRLQTLISADHKFNLTAAADDGYHNLVHLTEQAPTGVLAAVGRLYAKTSASRVHLHYMDDQAQEYQITPTMPIRAAVNFDGSGGAVIRSQFNVSSVVHDFLGKYTITFTTPMPDNNYIVSGIGMRGAGERGYLIVEGSATYGNSVSTNFVKITCINDKGDPKDAKMINIMILSAT
jgi:hypothetical protein